MRQGWAQKWGEEEKGGGGGTQKISFCLEREPLKQYLQPLSIGRPKSHSLRSSVDAFVRKVLQVWVLRTSVWGWEQEGYPCCLQLLRALGLRIYPVFEVQCFSVLKFGNAPPIRTNPCCGAFM